MIKIEILEMNGVDKLQGCRGKSFLSELLSSKITPFFKFQVSWANSFGDFMMSESLLFCLSSFFYLFTVHVLRAKLIPMYRYTFHANVEDVSIP